MRARSLIATAAFGLALAGAQTASACGAMNDPCSIEGGTYHAVTPPWKAGDAPFPAIVHFHGSGGTGSGVLDEQEMVDPALARGYAFIAPNGEVRGGGSRTGWRFRPQDTNGRDELEFVRAVLKDAETRFHIDRSRVLLTGFSIGGSLTWYLACRAPNDFAAFAPVSGGFWVPQPETCAGPVKMLHTHGWIDRTVPLEGRPLGNLGVQQSDIFQGMQVWRRMNGCAAVRPDEFDTSGVFWIRRWTSCAPGTALEFALHKGGHEMMDEWMPMAIDWFEKVLPKKQAAR